jgi:DNA-binding transcriptional ArsR family regulator
MSDSICEIGPCEAPVAAEMFKALAHPLRLRIISLLSRGKMHVTGLAEQLEVSQAIVSQQLRVLRSSNLVAAETEGGHAYYRIIEPHLYDMLQCLGRCMASRNERGVR